MIVKRMIGASSTLRDDVESFADSLVKERSVDAVYNPLAYAWKPHHAYLELASGGGAKTLLLGMNPGPHGMGQMGIPFAATSVVRDLLKITDLEVEQPRNPHPKRPVSGLDWPKEEVSGTRLWGLLADEYGNTESIFKSVFLLNHCPLMLFSGERATNITPDKITGPTTKALLERCDEHLREVVDIMQIERVIGVGRYSEKRASKALSSTDIEVTTCWHPSPASPLANRNGGADWRANVRAVLPNV
ncbi:MAG: uracil-DNA glycosylase family protein [Candidatus Thermoplasmatota archaeon]|nr:uracil-DNA glycosylase family protein [Candidatus Thermoplasmatota archaeon]